MKRLILVSLLCIMANICFSQNNLIAQFIQQKGLVFSSFNYSTDQNKFIGVSTDYQSLVVFQLKNGSLNLIQELDLGVGNGSFRPKNFPPSKFIDYSIYYLGEINNFDKEKVSKMTFNNYQNKTKSRAPFILPRNYDFILINGTMNHVFTIDYDGIILHESKITLPKNVKSENITLKTTSEEIFIYYSSENNSKMYELNPINGKLIDREPIKENLR